MTPEPLASPTPSAAPTASAVPGSGDTRPIRLDGSAYSSAIVPDGSRVRRVGQSAVIISTRDSADSTWVTWTMPEGSLPANAHITRVDAAICGSGEGDFWEVYGPAGSDPAEYEATLPSGDGCWHFMNAPGNGLDVTAGALLESHMTITAVEFVVTFTAAAP